MGCLATDAKNGSPRGERTHQIKPKGSADPYQLNKSEPLSIDTIMKKILEKVTQKSKQKNKFRYDRIFKASQNKFQASAFHQNFLVAVTTTNCIFGGFTPCQWKKDELNQYQTDQKCLSFLFKVQDSNIIFFNLQEPEKQKAICNNESCGPIFGQGHDLYISDQCDKRFCWANLGKSYQTKHRYGSIKANCELGGLEKFKIKDYQIWALTEGTN